VSTASASTSARRAPRRSRSDVVQTAGRLFAERGFHGTSMRDLGEEMGLLGSSLYAHIGSKAELLVEIVEEGAQLFQGLADDVAHSTARPDAKLAALITGHVRILTDNLDRAATYLNEARHLPDEPRARIVAMRDRYQQAFRAVLEEGVATGAFRAGLDTRHATTFVLSLLNALDRWYRPDGADGPIAVAGHLTDFVLEGIAA
jgi:TetR/AcrR family transcriptional regulator, cholesterol catabolism regulator